MSSCGWLKIGAVMLTACNSSRTTLRMLFSSLSVCSAARILCTRNSLRLAGGTCCNNAHARRCCGSLRFGRKTYCGRFIPHPRSGTEPAGKNEADSYETSACPCHSWSAADPPRFESYTRWVRPGCGFPALMHQRRQVVVVVDGFVALDWLPSGAANKKTPAELKESLAGVRFVAAIGCKTGWERTMPRLDGVVAVIDANVHGFCLAFVVVEICGSM